MVAPPPAVVIAAPASGSGKTTVTTGLLAALARRGVRVAPFKVGPDFIDPGYHAAAAGRPGRNLDAVMCGEDLIGPLYRHGAAGAELALIEGVMGLFDGRGTSDEGSTAHIARLLGLPVVMVVDARGAGRSVGALLAGFATFDPRIAIAGVILNRVGSARHELVLRAGCEEAGVPVLGAVPRSEVMELPSRHLGLVPEPEHRGVAGGAIAAMASLVGDNVDLSELRRLARVPAVAAPAWDPADALAGALAGSGGGPVEVLGPRPVVAVAGGPAFTFGYAERDELLRVSGAELVTVDPMVDAALPPGVAALVLPGGFPEEHTGALTANVSLREQLRTKIAGGLPVHAECGGLLYLCRELDGVSMVGALAATARFGARLTLGYRDAVFTAQGLLPDGARVTGHEFHHTVIAAEPAAGPAAGPVAGHWTDAWTWRDGEGLVRREGFTRGGQLASYLHTHPAATPLLAANLVAAARRFGAAPR